MCERSQVCVLTPPAAQDLHPQVEGVSELQGDDAQVACADQTLQPAGHRGAAHHAHLKHLTTTTTTTSTSPQTPDHNNNNIKTDITSEDSTKNNQNKLSG